MWNHRSPIGALLGAAFLGSLLTACADPGTLSEESFEPLSSHFNHNAAAGAEKGYIDGWFDGSEVELYYTKSFFCAEPPSNCEIGAPSDVSPRPGSIPTIYAIAAVGFQPDPATVACLAGSPCLNHPAMIDASRVGGSATASPPSHSHILDTRRAGWFHTVNIRVFSQTAWNEIAAARTLAKVRDLQGNNPAVGVPGVISADTPTNIYFFIAGWR